MNRHRLVQLAHRIAHLYLAVAFVLWAWVIPMYALHAMNPALVDESLFRGYTFFALVVCIPVVIDALAIVGYLLVTIVSAARRRRTHPK